MGDPQCGDELSLQAELDAAAGVLSVRYVALFDQTGDEYEAQRWMERIIELREQRRAAQHSRREDAVRCIEQWSDTLRYLDRMERGSGW